MPLRRWLAQRTKRLSAPFKAAASVQFILRPVHSLPKTASPATFGPSERKTTCSVGWALPTIYRPAAVWLPASFTPNRTTPCDRSEAVEPSYFRVAEGKRYAAQQIGGPFRASTGHSKIARVPGLRVL